VPIPGLKYIPNLSFHPRVDSLERTWFIVDQVPTGSLRLDATSKGGSYIRVECVFWDGREASAKSDILTVAQSARQAWTISFSRSKASAKPEISIARVGKK
jgi:hypothetical protein